MIVVYLDTCTLHRPLDDKSSLRIALESEAILGLLAMCEAGLLEMLSSEALLFEIKRNPDAAKQDYVLQTPQAARSVVILEPSVEERARELSAAGIKPLDALHLASAEAGHADYLCTCDDRFLKRARSLGEFKTRVVSPIELIGEVEQW